MTHQVRDSLEADHIGHDEIIETARRGHNNLHTGSHQTNLLTTAATAVNTNTEINIHH